MKEITYTIDENFNHTFDEKSNMILAIRKVCWGESDEPKLDIRKWYVDRDGNETVGKGVSFLTEEGPHELTQVLTKEGYGDTVTILNNIKDRSDFNLALNVVMGKENEFYSPDAVEEVEYYDPKTILF